jgi:hypothetical protein
MDGAEVGNQTSKSVYALYDSSQAGLMEQVTNLFNGVGGWQEQVRQSSQMRK